MEPQEEMIQEKTKRGISVGEGIGFAILIVGQSLWFYNSTQVRLSVLETQQRNGEADRSRIETKLDKLNIKMDEMKDDIGQIKVNSK